ncbi:MAG: LysR family transcriptional regulator [Cellulosilyticaceae bacterium]
MIEELKTYIQVVKYKNFTKAGKVVNLSQPTVSLHIKRLEKYFNTILIERSSKSKQVIITQQGNVLYKKGLELIKNIEDIKVAIEISENQVLGKLVVGASQTIGEHFLPKMLKQFSNKYPNLSIECIIENTASICERLRNREVDISIIEGVEIKNDFIRGTITGDKMVLVVSNDSPLNSSENLMNDLQNQVWISREEGSGTQEFLEHFLERNNIQPKNTMVFSSNFAVQEAVKNGLGITLISEHVVKHAIFDKELAVIALEADSSRKYTYMIPRDAEISPATNAFVEMLKKY